MLSTDELAHPEQSFNRLLFAAQDMGESKAAVDFLLARSDPEDVPGDVRRALETGAVVAYARPWGRSNSIGGLDDHWLPDDPKQFELHAELITVRNKVYAHTDEEINARWVGGVVWDEGELRKPTAILPAWRPLNLDLLPEISQLAEDQKNRFVSAVMELVQRS